jgi:hypothetical protein
MCPFWVLNFFENYLPSRKIICYPHPRILACITPLWNMRPPLIYPQLHHFHNHGLAIPFHFIWNKILEECFSPHLSSKSPSPQRDGALKKREREREREGEKVLKKEEEKENLQESLQIK